MMRKIIPCCLFSALFALVGFVSSLHAEGLVVGEDTLWSGEVTIDGDVLVRSGATLTIAPGTRVTIQPSDSTRTEPQYLSSYTELTVRGVLKAEGTEAQPIIFAVADPAQARQWAGIMVDGGSVRLSWCRVGDADSALTVIRGRVDLTDCRLFNSRYGMSVVSAAPEVHLSRTVFDGNDYGLVLLNGAGAVQESSRFINSRQKDTLTSPAFKYRPEEMAYPEKEQEEDAPYQSESMLGTVVWKDRVTVNGVIRIPAKSRLIIMPGTVVEFTRNDTNGDGIGENGLLVMGMLIAKGTREEPIIFRSAEKERRAADWDAINIYTSDGFQNLLEYVQIEDAFRALHIHFSNVLVNHAVLRRNYRGMQFQESVVEVRDSDIYGNKSALRARDSELQFTGNRVYDNYFGPNIFRMTGSVRENIFSGHYGDGLRVREGALTVSGNTLVGNRYGMTVAYANYGAFGENVLMHNHEAGVVLKGTDNIKVAGNFIQSNGGNGVSLLDSRAELSGNEISLNGERGIGVISFSGTITGNNIVGNRLYGLGLDGGGDVDAAGNWWGAGTDMGEVIYDRADEPGLGRVGFAPVLSEPAVYRWPLAQVPVDTVWQGEVHIPRRVNTLAGTTLRIMPATVLRFAPHRGMWANGAIEAVGTPAERILITGMAAEDGGEWHQIMVEKASATFVNCDFEQAETALHAHFSTLTVKNCSFRANQTGMMFKGGPVRILASRFTANSFGLVFNKALGRMSGSLVRDNEVGIMVRAQTPDGIRVSGSNIHRNSRYNLKMGDFNNGVDIDVRNNWWGMEDAGESIFDARAEEGIGFARFMPTAASAFPLPELP